MVCPEGRQARGGGKMTHASLFSGIGGGEIAASMMGWENVFHCEIQGFPRRVLEYWYPNSTSYEDITKTDFTPWRGKIDILTGGFPCQPFSCAGKRKGAEDDRYLWPEMLRAIREIQPSWVVGENVAGILSMVQPGSESEVGGESTLFGEDNEIWERRQQYIVETVCQDLEREGYSVQPFVIPACAVGAPHRRDRVWFIARQRCCRPVDTGIEAMQQGRQDGAPAYAHRDRFGKREDEQEPVGEREGTSHDSTCGENGASSYAECGGGGKILKDLQPGQPDGQGIDGVRCERDAANSDSERLSTELFPSCNDKEGRQAEYGHAEQSSDHDGEPLPADWWRNFPTEPPVRSRDDGLSPGVADLSIPWTKWRTESIKALGNAIVPQVLYEIFRAIEMEESL